MQISSGQLSPGSDWKKELVKTKFDFLEKPWEEINKQSNSPVPRPKNPKVAFKQGTKGGCSSGDAQEYNTVVVFLITGCN